MRKFSELKSSYLWLIIYQYPKKLLQRGYETFFVVAEILR